MTWRSEIPFRERYRRYKLMDEADKDFFDWVWCYLGINI